MSELLTISIRRKLDKGDKITTNEIRALLATVQAYKNKIEELEAKLAAKPEGIPAGSDFTYMLNQQVKK